MTLMRAFARVDEKGKIPIPKNIAREAGLKPGAIVEVKIIGASKAKNILLSKRKSFR